jgi:putative iron-only hydrogenase system regulator
VPLEEKNINGGVMMETRVALIGIMIENSDEVETLNGLLSQFSEYIIGRMGIPYQQKGVSLISIAIDAPADKISALSGKIGRLKGISAKVIYQKAIV